MKTAHRLAYAAVRRWWRLTRPYTLGVRVLLVRDGQVLLVRHTYRRDWFFPGGGVSRGETLEDAARREAREEAGAVLGPLRLLGAYTTLADGQADHVIFFGAETFALEGDSDWEIESARFFPLDALPEDTSPATARRLAEYLRGTSNPSGPW